MSSLVHFHFGLCPLAVTEMADSRGLGLKRARRVTHGAKDRTTKININLIALHVVIVSVKGWGGGGCRSKAAFG